MTPQDPNKLPIAPDGFFAMAAGQQLIPISVHMINKVPKEQILSMGMQAINGPVFWSLTHAVPRIGEFIRSENGKLCEVTCVVHSIVPSDGTYQLLHSVFAVFEDKATA